MTTTSVEPPSEPTLPDSLDRPSRWLRSGYVPFTLGNVTGWKHVRADHPIDPSDGSTDRADVDELFRRDETRKLLAQLGGAFQPFLPVTPAQWEGDLRQSPCPETLLRLWQTVLGVFNYYIGDKKLPPGAATDYFWLVIDFCNDGAQAALRYRRLLALQPGRVQRVIDEMARYFARPCPAGAQRTKRDLF